MHEPTNDPLFEEAKKIERKSLSLSPIAFQDVGGRKVSEMSSNHSQSTHNNENSANPSPRNDQGSNAKKRLTKSFAEEEEKKQINEILFERNQQATKMHSIDETDQQPIETPNDENLEFPGEEQPTENN